MIACQSRQNWAGWVPVRGMGRVPGVSIGGGWGKWESFNLLLQEVPGRPSEVLVRRRRTSNNVS